MPASAPPSSIHQRQRGPTHTKEAACCAPAANGTRQLHAGHPRGAVMAAACWQSASVALDIVGDARKALHGWRMHLRGIGEVVTASGQPPPPGCGWVGHRRYQGVGVIRTSPLFGMGCFGHQLPLPECRRVWTPSEPGCGGAWTAPLPARCQYGESTVMPPMHNRNLPRTAAVQQSTITTCGRTVHDTGHLGSYLAP